MITVQWMPVFTEQLSYDPNITYFEPEPAFRYLTNQRDKTDFLR